MEQSNRLTLQILAHQMETAKMHAAYWTSFATSPANLERDIKHGGTEGVQLTNTEKIKAAFNIVLNHIHRYNECAEMKIDILSKMESPEFLGTQEDSKLPQVVEIW